MAAGRVSAPRWGGGGGGARGRCRPRSEDGAGDDLGTPKGEKRWVEIKGQPDSRGGEGRPAGVYARRVLPPVSQPETRAFLRIPGRRR